MKTARTDVHIIAQSAKAIKSLRMLQSLRYNHSHNLFYYYFEQHENVEDI